MNKEEVKQLMEKVNDYWIKQNPEPGDCAWEKSVYFMGDLEAYHITGRTDYLEYAVKWADRNGWSFYDDAGNNTENADNISCGQSYMDMIEIGVNSATDVHMLKTLNNLVKDTNNDYWWWVDTIYMALPLFYRISQKYKTGMYAEKGHALYTDTKIRRRLFDEREGLWYRDERFLPGAEFVPDGEKIFWGRGNGWIFAGIARTLMYSEHGCAHYEEYSKMLNIMACELEKYQQKDGFWRCNIKSPDDVDVPETSATVLIGYGMALGVRLGILDKKYLQCALRAFEGVNKIALSDDGRIGYVQGIAWGPTPVYESGTNDYAVGVYLLLAGEIFAICD